MKHILMVHTRELCYFSGGFFLDRMQESLEQLGVKVTRLSLAEDDETFDVLEQYMGRQYQGIVDINSKLPYLMLEGKGEYLLDNIDAPFFNYILDHPLYHHPGLSFPLHNYHAIGIDDRHCEYMKKYYPHLQSVSCLGIAGTEALNPKPVSRRRYPVLFTGTYENEERFLPLLREMGGEISSVGMEVIPMMLQSDITIEDAVCQLLQQERYAALTGESSMKLPEVINRLYPVDKYVRNRRRNELLLAVAQRGIPLTIMGEGWEQSPLSAYANVTLLPGQTIARSFETIADSRILIDVNPFFAQGIHDRVTTAMANRVLCITNMSAAADPLLKEGKMLEFYSGHSGEELADQLEEMLRMTEGEQEKRTEEAYGYYQKEYSWQAHGRKLWNIIEKISET